MKSFIDDYAWIFNAEGKVNKGLECALIEEYNDWSWDEPQRKVVTLAGYSPYYTDGTADPTPEDIYGMDCCMIEVDGDVNDPQVRLGELYHIDLYAEAQEMLYNGNEVECIGTCSEGEYSVILKDKDKVIVDTDDLEEICHIADCSEEECLELAGEVSRGSMYLSDYRNSLGIPCNEVSNYADAYYNALYEEYGDDNDEHDTVECFAHFLYWDEVA